VDPSKRVASSNSAVEVVEVLFCTTMLGIGRLSPLSVANSRDYDCRLSNASGWFVQSSAKTGSITSVADGDCRFSTFDISNGAPIFDMI